jgi:limonene-1,2-epoxide hydrolase
METVMTDTNTDRINTDHTEINVLGNSAWLTNFISVYHQLSTDNLHLLEQIYHAKVDFIDPIHEIHGFDALSNYFDGLYQNVSYCQFNIHHVVETELEAAIYWTMTYQHKQLNGGEKITVTGSSHLKAFEGKIIYHRDYIDLGEMLYENIPLLGRLISWIKKRAANA